MTQLQSAMKGVAGDRAAAVWILPIAAGAVGLALAWAFRRLRNG